MIKKITLLALLLVGTVGAMAQSKINHAEDLKKEALEISTSIVKADRAKDASITTVTEKAGDKNVKVTKENGKIVRIGTMEAIGNKMHMTIFFYKKGKLIMSVYNVAVKDSKAKIANYRYYNSKGKCESSVLQDGINGDNSVKETTDNSKDAQTRLNESKEFMKLAKAESLAGFASLQLLKF
jgi:hypothetical protein